MNDRYLYRAKRTDNEKWVEGNLLFDVADNQYRIALEREYSTGTFYSANAPRVNRNTICQCTGLKDKNGKLIWENDIVNVSTNKGNTLCEVRYADSVAQFQLWQSKTLHKTSTVLNLGNYREEVCGNRFDNPELLEVRENET